MYVAQFFILEGCKAFNVPYFTDTQFGYGEKGIYPQGWTDRQ